MKKVLIAIDYDLTARKVAEAGYSLAKAMNAKITLLHVVANDIQYTPLDYSPITGFGGFMDFNPLKQESLDWAKNASVQFLDSLKKHLGDNEIETVVEEGEVATSILKAASEMHADLIVIGSHSRRWLDEILMGSVAEKVMHHTLTPLYVVPTKKKED